MAQQVAGPVFKEIADKLYALNADTEQSSESYAWKTDSSIIYYAGSSDDMKEVMKELQMKYTDSSGKK